MSLELTSKKKALPFLWNGQPNALWTFKNEKGCARIGIIPEEHNYFNKDISNKQVFGDTNKNFDLNTLLKNIPYIQIREYTQETRLDLVMSLVDIFKKGFTDGENAAKDIKNATVLKWYSKLLTDDIKNISNVPEWKQIASIMFKDRLQDTNFSKNEDIQYWMLGFVYEIYYRILTTATTNVYTLPFPYAYKMFGNGFDGFDSASNLLGGLGNDNKLLKFISPSFSLTTTPLWQGSKGGEGVNIELSFNLFNDTMEKAINNFIFVNTLIPMNMPLQYAVLTQPPSLYDIKIAGCNRLFMCSGQFECNYKGVFRKPPRKKFFNELNKHINKSILSLNEFSMFLEHNDIIKIPDVYEITMHFKSLLPNNFNNFMFQFTGKNTILKKYDDKPENGMMEKSDEIMGKVSDWAKGLIPAAQGWADRELEVEKETAHEEYDEEQIHMMYNGGE